MALSYIFTFLSTLVSIYTIMCFLRIIFTWIPSLSYSKAARFLAAACDPYLNFFRRIRWLTIGNLDFSPALALCILGAGTSIFGSLARGRVFSFSRILIMIVEALWSIGQSLLTFLILTLAIRLIILLVTESRNKRNSASYSYDFNSYNRQSSGSYILEALDRSLSPIIYTIAGTFTRGTQPSFKKALIISVCSLIAAEILLIPILNLLIGAIALIPF